MSTRRIAQNGVRLASAGRSKYGAVKTLVDGIRFDSKAEARRYYELKLLQAAGEISDLTLQPRFPLYVYEFGNREEPAKIGEYVADFGYIKADGEEVTEDVKGFSTPMYRWKKRHVAAQYGITILEVR